jgi:tRNA(adenine34) deaminase
MPADMSSGPNPYMQLALEEARKAADMGEVPVGAVIVSSDGGVLAHAHNRVETDNDPTAHAEMLVIRAACALLETPRLMDCDLYVTLEPCAMCAQALSHARIRRVYYGAPDPKGGGVAHGARVYSQPTCHHKPEVYEGIGEQESADLLKKFFQNLRN